MAIIRLSASAEADIISLLAWTEQHFGDLARGRYEILLAAALRDLAINPGRIGSIVRSELGQGVCSYHLRHSRETARALDGFVRKPRHFLLYRATVPGLIGIGRVLHDMMELERHLPPDYGDE